MNENIETVPAPQAQPVFPPVVQRRTLAAAERMAPLPDGEISKSWMLRHLKDTRENVIEHINGAQSVPAAVKAFLVDAIQQSHPNSRLIEVDAHCQVVKLKDGRVKNHGCWDISDI